MKLRTSHGTVSDEITPSVHRSDDRPVSELILDAVARREGTHPAHLEEPLYDVIDPETVDRLFDHASSEVVLEFSYLGYPIVVHGNGTVVVAT